MSSESSTSDEFGTTTRPTELGRNVQNFLDQFINLADPNGDAYRASARFRRDRWIDPARPSCNGLYHTYRCGHTVRENTTACCGLCVFPRWGARKVHRRCDRCQRELHEFFLMFMLIRYRWTFGALDNHYDEDGGHEGRYLWVRNTIRRPLRDDVWYHFLNVGREAFIDEAWQNLCEAMGYDAALMPDPIAIFEARVEAAPHDLPGIEGPPEAPQSPEPAEPPETRYEHWERLLTYLDPYDADALLGLNSSLVWLLHYAVRDPQVRNLVVEYLEDESVDADRLDRADIREIDRYLPQATRDLLISLEAHAHVSPLHRQLFDNAVMPAIQPAHRAFMRGNYEGLTMQEGFAIRAQVLDDLLPIPRLTWDTLHDDMLEADELWDAELDRLQRDEEAANAAPQW